VLFLLVAVSTRAADALGVGGRRLHCACKESCWCKRPRLTLFRWVTPGRWHQIRLMPWREPRRARRQLSRVVVPRLILTVPYEAPQRTATGKVSVTGNPSYLIGNQQARNVVPAVVADQQCVLRDRLLPRRRFVNQC